MWKKKDEMKEEVRTEHITAILEAGCEFEGKLSFQGTARIAGDFKGEILASDTLIVGKGAKVVANIEVNSIIIHGEVVGDIKAKEKIEIFAPAVFQGNVTTPSLFVEEGVVFQGNTKMEKPQQQTLIADDGETPQITANA